MRTIMALPLLAMTCLGTQAAQDIRTAQAVLINSSLQLNTGACDCDIGGLIWHIDFSSAYTEDRGWANHELALSASATAYSHWTYMIMEDPGMWTAVSFLELNLPMEDGDMNGLPDFYETGNQISTTSQGTYQIEWGPCPLTVTWYRPAGSALGSYQLVMNDSILGKVGPFRGSFSVIQAQGALHYVPGRNEVKGDFSFPATGATPPLQGPVTFKKSTDDPENKLTLQAGALTNAFGGATFEATSLIRHGSVYGGNLALSTGEYSDWALLVTDSNDSDRDGIPDLSDTPLPPLNPPELSLKLASGGLQLLISGNSSGTCHLEETSSLNTGFWKVLNTFSLTNDPHPIDLSYKITSAPKYWRARVE
jgi:hypothetical protein